MADDLLPDRSGKVRLGDAVGMAVWPLENLDPVAVRVGDPAGPRPGGATRMLDRPGLDPLGGEIGACCVQRVDLDNQVIDAGAGTGLTLGRIVDQLNAGGFNLGLQVEVSPRWVTIKARDYTRQEWIKQVQIPRTTTV